LLNMASSIIAMADKVKTHCLNARNIITTAIPNAAGADTPLRAASHLDGGASGSLSLNHVLTAVMSRIIPASKVRPKGAT
jgi:hypothetical protein